MGVFSLNHDTATSYRLGHAPVLLEFTSTCTCIMAIRVYTYAHPQHLKVIKLFVYVGTQTRKLPILVRGSAVPVLVPVLVQAAPYSIIH
jgi:hypothetical protein